MSSPSHPSVFTTLLDAAGNGNSAAWERLLHICTPTVAHWCRQAGLSPEDVADVTQQVRYNLARSLPTFRRDRGSGSFTAWLCVITDNCLRTHFARRGREPQAVGGSSFLERQAQLPAPDNDSSSVESSARRTLLRRLLDLVRPDFELATWQAFWGVVVEQRTPADVAAELGLTVNAVRIAKFRVLKTLRERAREIEG